MCDRRSREQHVCLGCGRDTWARSHVCNRCMYGHPPAATRPCEDGEREDDILDEGAGPDTLDAGTWRDDRALTHGDAPPHAEAGPR